MASSSFRAHHLYLSLVFLLLCSLQLSAHASVIAPPRLYPLTQTLEQRTSVTLNNATGQLEAFNPVTQQLIPQSTASDGGGTGFDVPAIIWIGFCFFVGAPMAFAGFRGWRLTTGTGIGLASAVCSWAALISSMSSNGIPDLLLTLVVVGFFGLGFILGVFEIGRLGGMACLGISGGLAFGIRVVLLRPGLLFTGLSFYWANWILIAVFGLAGGMVMVWGRFQRSGILFACASVGTFLSFLGVDLIFNKQQGMSRGLRFLFDRNSSHIVDILTKSYSPPLSTLILIGISLASTPLLSYAQHRFFKLPFRPKKPQDEEDIITGADGLPAVGVDRVMMPSPMDEKRSTFLIGLWDTARFKGKSPNRFSLE